MTHRITFIDENIADIPAWYHNYQRVPKLLYWIQRMTACCKFLSHCKIKLDWIPSIFYRMENPRRFNQPIHQQRNTSHSCVTLILRRFCRQDTKQYVNRNVSAGQYQLDANDAEHFMCCHANIKQHHSKYHQHIDSNILSA